jgi:hypothetical protein
MLLNPLTVLTCSSNRITPFPITHTAVHICPYTHMHTPHAPTPYVHLEPGPLGVPPERLKVTHSDVDVVDDDDGEEAACDGL